jgi:hypothetical protein
MLQQRAGLSVIRLCKRLGRQGTGLHLEIAAGAAGAAGALKSGFTRTGKRTLGGLIDDGVKSMGRYYLNNFQVRGERSQHHQIWMPGVDGARLLAAADNKDMRRPDHGACCRTGPSRTPWIC